jgi:hypothetical protein
MKIRPVGAEFFHADRRTDGRTHMTKLTVALRNFSNAPKIYKVFLVHLVLYRQAHSRHLPVIPSQTYDQQ